MNTSSLIVASVILIIAVLILVMVYKDTYPKNKKDDQVASEKVASMSVDAFFLAILLVMAFTPIGYITVVPGLSLTLMHLPVLLGAALFGWKKGLLYGLVFGLTSYVNALMNPVGLNAMFAFFWVAIPPRVLFGLLSGIVFSLIGKLHKKGAKAIYLPLVCFLLTVAHTVLVFTDLFLFHGEEVSALFFSSQTYGIGFTFAGIIGLGMLGEGAIAAVIIAPLSTAINKAAPRFIVHVRQH